MFSLFHLFVISSFRVALFRLFAWRYFVCLHGVISSFRMVSFRREKTKRRHAKRRQDKITPSEKTKRRHVKRRKDATRKDGKIKVSNGVFLHGIFVSFRAKISSFRATGFVFSHGVISSLFFLSFRMVFFRRLFDETTTRLLPIIRRYVRFVL